MRSIEEAQQCQGDGIDRLLSISEWRTRVMCYYMLPLQNLTPALQIRTADFSSMVKLSKCFTTTRWLTWDQRVLVSPKFISFISHLYPSHKFVTALGDCSGHKTVGKRQVSSFRWPGAFSFTLILFMWMHNQLLKIPWPCLSCYFFIFIWYVIICLYWSY